MNALSEWLMWAVGGVAATLAPVGKVIKSNRDRSRANQRQLQGDPDDPNSEGVLQIAKRNGEKIDHLEERMEEQHRQVLSKVEELHDDQG